MCTASAASTRKPWASIGRKSPVNDDTPVDAGEQSFTGDVGPMDDVGFRVDAIQGDAVGLNGDPGR